MQGGVVEAGRRGAPGGEPDRPGDGEPGVSGEQAGGGEPGQPGAADGAARDVVDGEPAGERDHAEPGEAPSRVVPPHGDGRAGADHRGGGDEPVGGAAAQEGDPREFEALTGDGQDEERGEPRDDVADGAAADPQHAAGVPGDGAHDLDGEVASRPAAEDRDVDRDEPAAGGGEQQPPGEHEPGGGGEPARGGEGRGGVGPGAAEGDGAFEGDQRAEESEGHQRAVLLRERGARQRDVEVQQAQGAPERDQERQQRAGEQRKPARRRTGHGPGVEVAYPCDLILHARYYKYK